MNLVLADRPSSTGSAQRQSSLAQEVFSERDLEDAMRHFGNVMDHGMQGHVFRLYLMFRHCK